MPNEKIVNMGDMPDENRKRESEKEALIYLVALQAKQLEIDQNKKGYKEFVRLFHKAEDIKQKLECFETQEAKALGLKRPSGEELLSETIKFYHNTEG